MTNSTVDALIEVREDLKSIPPYGAPQLEASVLLNVNENPYPINKSTMTQLTLAAEEYFHSLNRYPDRDCLVLRQALAKYLSNDAQCKISEAQVWPANGSNEVLQQIFQLFGGPGASTLIPKPAYPMYQQYCRTTLTPLELFSSPDTMTFDIDLFIEEIRVKQPSIVLVTSPNNPTGQYLGLGDIKRILSISEGLVIVDEAYAEFRNPEHGSAVSFVEKHPNLIVTRTFSKAFAMAGLRLGYLAASKEIVTKLGVVRLPYHISGLVQSVAVAALENSENILGSIEQVRQEREAQQLWFANHSVKSLPSQGNFILFRVKENSRKVWQGLLDQGVLIRETEFAQWLRVSIGTKEEMVQFRAALLNTISIGKEG